MNEHHLADEQPAKVELLDDKIPDLTESGIYAREDVQERPETRVQKTFEHILTIEKRVNNLQSFSLCFSSSLVSPSLVPLLE